MAFVPKSGRSVSQEELLIEKYKPLAINSVITIFFLIILLVLIKKFGKFKNFNKSQKIIFSSWIVVSMGVWAILLICGRLDCGGGDTINCLLLELVTVPLVLLVVFGIPSLVLFKVWQSNDNPIQKPDVKSQ